jgi:hypothetical protein
MPKPAHLNKFVSQRGGNDCVIATLSTVFGRNYEEVTEAFELPLDDHGCAQVGKGIEILDSVLGRYPSRDLRWHLHKECEMAGPVPRRVGKPFIRSRSLAYRGAADAASRERAKACL